MQGVFGFHLLGHSQKMELLFDSGQPLICLEWFFGLFEDRRLGIQEVLEITILIQPRPWQ
jgi:hypothetical protein